MRALLPLLLLTACAAEGGVDGGVEPLPDGAAVEETAEETARLVASLGPLLPDGTPPDTVSGPILRRGALVSDLGSGEGAHPLVGEQFGRIAALPPFRAGATEVRIAGPDGGPDGGPEGGVLAFSRFHPVTGAEVLVVANFGAAPRAVEVDVDAVSRNWVALAGVCATAPEAPGRFRAVVAGRDVAVCAAVDGPAPEGSP